MMKRNETSAPALPGPQPVSSDKQGKMTSAGAKPETEQKQRHDSGTGANHQQPQEQELEAKPTMCKISPGGNPLPSIRVDPVNLDLPPECSSPEHPPEPETFAGETQPTRSEIVDPDPDFYEIRVLTKQLNEEERLAKQEARHSSGSNPSTRGSPSRSLPRAAGLVSQFPHEKFGNRPPLTAGASPDSAAGEGSSPSRKRKEFPHQKFHGGNEAEVASETALFPGAYRSSGNVCQVDEDTVQVSDEDIQERAQSNSDSSGSKQQPLLEAFLVSEEELIESRTGSSNLEDRGDEERALRLAIVPAVEARRVGLRDLLQQHRSLQCLLCCIIIVAVVMVVVLTAVFASTGSGGNPPSDERPPLYKNSRVWSLFPNYTLAAIEVNRSGPQSKAYEWTIRDPNFWNYTDWRITQRFALATLYYATAGPTWTRNAKWLNYAHHECEWYSSPDFGYFRNVNGTKLMYYSAEEFPCEKKNASSSTDRAYEHLWLDQNNLRGELPLEMYWLTSLKSLSIFQNSIQGTLSSHIGFLTNLEALNLRYTENLQGIIPTQIGLAKNMSFLSLTSNMLQGSVPSELGLLTQLTFLSLRYNELTGQLPSSLGQLSKLIRLRLDGNLLHGTIPSDFGKMVELVKLVLVRNQLHGPLPSELGQLTKLSGLWVYDNRLTGTLFTELGNLKALNDSLSCDSNFITGTVPSELGQLVSLQYLWLNNNHLTGSFPTAITNQNMSLIEFSFGQNEMTGPIPSELALMTANLEGLWLDGNMFSGHLPSELAGLGLNGSLTYLNITENPLLTGTIPSGLCHLDYGFFFDCQPQQLCGCNCTCVAANHSFTAADDSSNSFPGEGLSVTIETNNITITAYDEGGDDAVLANMNVSFESPRQNNSIHSVADGVS